jgi:hypothetical protein
MDKTLIIAPLFRQVLNIKNIFSKIDFWARIDIFIIVGSHNILLKEFWGKNETDVRTSGFLDPFLFY